MTVCAFLTAAQDCREQAQECVELANKAMPAKERADLALAAKNWAGASLAHIQAALTMQKGAAK